MDVKAGKNIKILENGFEDFEDYWTDKSGSAGQLICYHCKNLIYYYLYGKKMYNEEVSMFGTRFFFLNEKLANILSLRLFVDFCRSYFLCLFKILCIFFLCLQNVNNVNKLDFNREKKKNSSGKCRKN